MNQNVKYLLLFLFFLNSLLGQIQGQVLVEVKMDTSMMLIGDQTYVTVEASFPEKSNIQLPFFADTIIGKLEILEVSKIDTVNQDGLLRIKQKYLVTIFDSGWYVIPPSNFIISLSQNHIDTIQSAPVYFGVMSMPLDTANANSITDIKPPLEAPITFKEVLPYATGGLGVLALLFVLFLLYKRFIKNKPVFTVKEKPKEPAHLTAYAELDRLREEKLWQQGLVKEYYSKLTEVLRIYMEDRFDILAMESTTDEILASLKSLHGIDKQVLIELELLLVLSDFVKFAKVTPLVDENEKSLQFAYSFVTRTKPDDLIQEGDVKPEQKNEQPNN